MTGTNGKTTTSRMIAHIARTSGLVVGWSNTDGIYRDGVLVEAGDYSGPSGAGRALGLDGVQLAVTETARGGILLKGIGITRNDVSVVTNVTADHLGLQGIDTVDQLAEVKSVVPRITRKDGWAVLNGDDPRVLAMRSVISAQPWIFSRDPDSPAVREALGHGGRATTVIDGWITVLAPGADPDPLVELVDVPMTLAGLSRFNIENALAAASAALAIGLRPRRRGRRPQVVPSRRRAQPRPDELLLVPRRRVSVVMDLAHNEAGLEALLEIMAGVRRPGARLLLGLGAVGDRTDELIDALGEIGAKGSDVVAIGHKEWYLRGRTMDEIDALLRAGAARVGVTDIDTYDDRGRVPRRAGRARAARRRGRTDVPRRAPGGLRLDRRPRRRAGLAGGAGAEGAGCLTARVSASGSDVAGVDLLAGRADVEVALDDHRRQAVRRARLVRLAGLPHGGLAGGDHRTDAVGAADLGLARRARPGADVPAPGGDRSSRPGRASPRRGGRRR